MEAKILSFPEAMTLASILDKYITQEELAVDFVDNILNRISPVEYLQCLVLLTGNTFTDGQDLDGMELLQAFYSGLEKNKIISLVESYKKLGFI